MGTKSQGTNSRDSKAPDSAAFIARETKFLDLPQPLALELGGELPVRVAYREWGSLDADGENCVVVCHALTGSADADRWWTQLFGPGRSLDPERDYIVCSNVLGSCYGTTGPTSVNPATGEPWRGEFPLITVRDMVRVQRELLRALGVRKVRMVIGGSLGGMQTLEWALSFPELVEAIVPIACPARHSAWAIGISEAQRQTIYADPRWKGGLYHPADPPAAGLAAARMAAMLSYRSMPSFEARFGRRPQSADLFAVESYLRYQGKLLVDRFDAASYVALTKAMDTHDVARGRGELEEVLRSVKQPALVVSVTSDVYYLPQEQEEIARLVPAARLAHLESVDGHDAFLIDVEWLNDRVAEFRGRLPGASGHRAPPAPATGPASASAPVAIGGGRSELNLLIVGPGQVGRELLDHVRRQRAVLERDFDFSLRVVGLANSRRVLYDEAGIDLDAWRGQLAAAPETGPFALPAAARLLERFGRRPAPVLVDLTADAAMGDVYLEAFRRGVHVVAANKLPLAARRGGWSSLMAAKRAAQREYHYGTTVGASLPVVDTLHSLMRTGDKVRRIEGSVSGTLGFLTADLTRGMPLSLVVRWAKELGYSEADPREDLSGIDAAHKAVILALELGWSVAIEDVERTPAVPPEALAPGSLQDLYQSLRTLDDAVAARMKRLRQEGKALRYLISVDPQAQVLRCGPVEVGAEHRASHLQGAEAYVAFWTERHSEQPLVVQGVGVGCALTAGGVLEDILKIAAGARQGLA